MSQTLFDSGALPVLERLVQFTSARHGVIVDNIANVSTPYYKPRDLNPRAFQETLRKAIDERRASADPMNRKLEVRDSAEVKFKNGRIETSPQAINEGILFHDQNNRDLERLMQRLAENTMTHNAAIEMIRSEFRTMETAIRERV